MSTYEWRKYGEEFRRERDDAIQTASDLLEDEAVRRAKDRLPQLPDELGRRDQQGAPTWLSWHRDTATLILV